MNLNTKTLVLGAIALVIVAAVSFGAGAFLHGDERAEMGMNRIGADRAIGMRGGFLAGQVASVNGNTLTLTQPDGSTRTVTLSNDTKIMKYATGTPADLAKGTTVSVSGTAAQDGSITADSVQIRPTGAGYFMGRPQ